jgi:uncharacterized protein (DUF58 family)
MMRKVLPDWGRLTRPFAGTDRGGPSGGDEPIFDEELLTRLRRLVLSSRRTIAEGLAGEHRSLRRGSSPEFADFKNYSHGDDFRRIDWNSYARLDNLFVRLSEVTTEFHVHVLLDASNSMDWRSSPDVPSKFTYARRAAGALGYIALWHHDRFTLSPFGRSLAPAFGPVQGRANAVPLLRYLEQLRPMGATNLSDVLDRYVHSRRRTGVLILVSDMLSGEPAEIAPALRELRGRGWNVTVIHVVDEAELAPSLLPGVTERPRPAELIELESGERLRLTPTAAVLSRYREAVGAWLTQVEDVCRDEQIDYLRLQTDWPVDGLVLRLLHERGVID